MLPHWSRSRSDSMPLQFRKAEVEKTRPISSCLGSWHRDRQGISRFRPVALSAHCRIFAGVTPDLSRLSRFSRIVKRQALHVLTRYVCGGVALRDSGRVSWLELLEAEASLDTGRCSDLSTLHGSAANAMVHQHRRFMQAVSHLSQRPLRPDHVLAAHACLSSELPEIERGKLRRCDVWWKGTSIDQAKFVAVPAGEIPGAMDRLLDEIDQHREPYVLPSSVERSRQAVHGASHSSSCDLAIAAYIALMAWHPFIDGNGRVARALRLALVDDGDDALDARLFTASHLLVNRALQPRVWGEQQSRCQRGADPIERLRAVCVDSAEFALCLCHSLLNGLQETIPTARSQAALSWSDWCPLLFAKFSDGPIDDDRLLHPVHWFVGKSVASGQATLEFLLAFESALRDCVEEAEPGVA